MTTLEDLNNLVDKLINMSATDHALLSEIYKQNPNFMTRSQTHMLSRTLGLSMVETFDYIERVSQDIKQLVESEVIPMTHLTSPRV